MARVAVKDFSKTANGEMAQLFTLDNGEMSACITNYGGTVVAINVKDKNGNIDDVALGYDTIAEYEQNGGYFGATVGRYANRIKNGEFTLNGVAYKLFKNDGNNHLHGGKSGFDKKLWDAKIDGDKLVMSIKSEDMEEGYPGNLTVCVTFSLSDSNELKLEYLAKSDKDTVLNLTNHAYFNLNGKGDVHSHEIKINADKFTRVDSEAIPTGELPSVLNTPFDFKDFHVIGERINENNADLKACGGYDHNFVLNNSSHSYIEAAVLKDAETGRKMTAYTDQEGIQLYAGNMIDPVKGKNGASYSKRSGLCLETQCYPDTPNQPDFPSCVLKANEEYKTTTCYKFGLI